MKFILSFFILIAPHFIFAQGRFDQQSLNEVALYFQRNGLQAGASEEFSKYRIVLVAGFGGDRFSFTRTFEENIRAIRIFSGGLDPILINPNSFSSVEQTADDLNIFLKETYRDNNDGRPFLLVGFSKGGVEVLTTLVRNPDLVSSGIVAGATLVQAPLQGARLASIGSDAIDLLGNILPKRGIYNQVVRRLLPEEGIKSISDEGVYKALLAPLERLSFDVKEMLSQRVFYVVSSLSARRAVGGRLLLNQVVRTIDDGRNDNVIAKSAMSIPGFGKIIGDLQGQHGQFTTMPNLWQSVTGTVKSTSHEIHAVTYLSLMATIHGVENAKHISPNLISDKRSARRRGSSQICERIF